MNSDKAKGEVDDALGRARRQVAEWTGDTEEEIKGKAEKAIGKVRDAVREKTHRKNHDSEGQNKPIDDVQRPEAPTRANR
jgi:uncharacterized protein YjbJ (UPF0337 family)